MIKKSRSSLPDLQEALQLIEEISMTKAKQKPNNEYVKTCDDEGLPHSVDDKPAIVVEGQGRFWYKNGNLHRGNDMPAAEWNDGSLEFWIDGKRTKKLTKEEAIFFHWSK
jgi:hypothetical protein